MTFRERLMALRTDYPGSRAGRGDFKLQPSALHKICPPFAILFLEDIPFLSQLCSTHQEDALHLLCAALVSSARSCGAMPDETREPEPV